LTADADFEIAWFDDSLAIVAYCRHLLWREAETYVPLLSRIQMDALKAG
jgi:hypothetical protein